MNKTKQGETERKFNQEMWNQERALNQATKTTSIQIILLTSMDQPKHSMIKKIERELAT